MCSRGPHGMPRPSSVPSSLKESGLKCALGFLQEASAFFGVPSGQTAIVVQIGTIQPPHSGWLFCRET